MKLRIQILGYSFLEIEGEKKERAAGNVYNNCVLDRPYPIVMQPNMKAAEAVNDDPAEAEKAREGLAAYVAKETGYPESEIKFILSTMDKYFK